MTLRNRLLSSYIVLLTVTLGIMAFALLLLLDAQPAPRDPTYGNLFESVQRLALGGNLLQEGLFGDFLGGDFAYLQAYADNNHARVMIVDLSDRTVVYDSSQAYGEGD